MSTVTYMEAAGEIVVGLDKSAARWRPAASARSTSQPLRAVRVSGVARRGIARTSVAKEGQAEIRGSARVRLDELARRRPSGSWTGSQDLGPVNRDLHLVVPERTTSSKSDVHSTRTQVVPKLWKGNSHDRLAAEAANGFLLEHSA
jgi:hypothetical protein